MMDHTLQTWCVEQEYIDRNKRRAKTSTAVHVRVLIRFGPDDSVRPVAVLRAEFPGATEDQVVEAGRTTHKDDVAQFAAWAEQRILRFTDDWFGFEHGRIPYALDVDVYTALGYACMCDLYAQFPRCRALHLRELQRVDPGLELQQVAFGAFAAHDPPAKSGTGHVFAPLRRYWDPFGLNKVWRREPQYVATHEHMADIVSAWDVRGKPLTLREKWALIASVCAFSAWPLPRIMCDVVFVALEPGSPAEARFRAVVPGPVLEVTQVGSWPKDVPSPRFVLGGGKLDEDTSHAFAFSGLDTLPGAKARGVVAGGVVASVMSTHWFAPELACTEDCPCRLARDVDVFTTNISNAGVKAALCGVPGIDVIETPFASMARLFMSFEMTHNQGGLVVDSAGALWVAGTPYAFASWLTMHTLCTGGRCTTRRVAKAQQKGFTVHTCGVPIDEPKLQGPPESDPDF